MKIGNTNKKNSTNLQVMVKPMSKPEGQKKDYIEWQHIEGGGGKRKVLERGNAY